jgi:hypothetical protein
MRLALTSLCLLALSCCATAPKHPEEAALRQFLERYFATWSAQDMAGYESCFADQARVSYVSSGGAGIDSQGLTDFIHGQKMSHQQSSTPMKEVPLEMKISGDDRVAQAEVSWKLTKGGEEQTGVDYFTLVKQPQGWRILSLAFFFDEKKEE